MELQKGTCFFCRNTTIIKPSQCQQSYEIISLLLPKEICNPTEFNKIQSSLRLCPICYHKLIILKRTTENIDPVVSNENSSSSCVLCKSKDNLFHIKKWPNLNVISEDIALTKNGNVVACSDCLFFLETKNEVKTKLLAKYPQLKTKQTNRNENKIKWKLKFTRDLKLHSTPLINKNKRRSRKTKPLKVIEILNDDDSLMRKVGNFDSIKQLSPLKDHAIFKDYEAVKNDFKFSNQIPYVLINMSNFLNTNSTFDESGKVESNKIIIGKTSEGNTDSVTKENKNSSVAQRKGRKLKTKSAKLISDLPKGGIVNDLVVNVLRIDIEKYIGKYESDPEIQNLIDKFSTLKSLNETEENVCTDDSCSTSLQDSFLEDTETSSEIKNKRKSVSFAEDKNVEIEYFQNESNIKLGNSNLDDRSAEVKKHSKGILKYEESVGKNIDTSENQNKQGASEEYNKAEESQELPIRPEVERIEEDNATDKQNLENEDFHSEETSKNKNPRNGVNTFAENENQVIIVESDSDDENLFDNYKSKLSAQKVNKPIRVDNHILSSVLETIKKYDVERKENVNHKNKEKTKRERPKPLSKKKKQNTAIENISIGDSNCSVDEEFKSSRGDKPKNICNSEIAATVESDKNDVLDSVVGTKGNDIEEDNTFNLDDVCDDTSVKDFIDDKSTSNDNELEKISNSEVAATEQSVENSDTSSVLETIENEDLNHKDKEKTKSDDPKPLSKRRRNTYIEDISDDDDAIISLSTDNQTVSNNDKLETTDSFDGSATELCLEDEAELQENVPKKLISEEKLEVEKVKREKPKPLSKKKKINIEKPEDLEKETNAGDDLNNSKVENRSDINEMLSSTQDVSSTDNTEIINDSTIPSLRIDETDNSQLEDNSHNTSINEVLNENINISADENIYDKDLDPQGNSCEEEINSSNSTLQNEELVATKSADVLDFCEVLNKNEEDTVSKKNDVTNSTEKIDTSKSDVESDNVTQLADKYLIDKDVDCGSSFIDNPEKDDLLNAVTTSDFGGQTKDSDEELVGENNKIDSLSTPSFIVSDDLGISEDDNDNINSILSDIFTTALPEDKLFETKSESETADVSDTSHGTKRKRSDDELNVSKEKKKKKVTFCEDVT